MNEPPVEWVDRPWYVQTAKMIGLIVVLFGLIVGVMEFFVVRGGTLF